MGVTTIVGFIIAAGCLVLAYILDGGNISTLFRGTAALIVFGGTIGATTMCFSFQELKTVPKLIKIILFHKHPDEVALIEQIVDLSDKVRREGVLYLEKQLPQIDDDFMRKGIQLVVDGTDPELVRMIMETELYAMQERHSAGAGVFEAAGGFAPTMGIIGTVLGLVHVLGNLDSPETLGPAIALAFIATLYGIGSANILWLPIAEKLKNIGKKEDILRELMLEGILSIQSGYNPLLVRERLTAFLRPRTQFAEEE
ncbi:Chemotaxis protein PomA [Pelotomaculum schinkii]|uniref:Chemotaxis protein PomA n=1 Tax=Pelotomaculum schinkii TaxID=78350 RepID=A0A4Y7R7H4_9FIRM|nr:flagellar motor protein [Pelotomaculum schinkii]TEB04908.1 Chemotaxis protein PomA [Pelotomaculum schinkii]